MLGGSQDSSIKGELQCENDIIISNITQIRKQTFLQGDMRLNVTCGFYVKVPPPRLTRPNSKSMHQEGEQVFHREITGDTGRLFIIIL